MPGDFESLLTAPSQIATRHAARALTLLEVLIAIALLLITAALVYPAFDARYRQTAFDESVRRIETLLNLARIEAQRTGTTMAVTWSPSTREIRVLPYQLTAEAMDEDDAAFFADAAREPGLAGAAFGAAAARGGGNGAGEAGAAEDADDPIGAPVDSALNGDASGSAMLGNWARFSVPDGVRAAAGAEARRLAAGDLSSDDLGGAGDTGDGNADADSGGYDAVFAAAGAGGADWSGADGLEREEGDPFALGGIDDAVASMTVAVFLADGSAILTQPLRLQSRDRDVALIEVSPWTGLPLVTRSRLDPEAAAVTDAEAASEGGAEGLMEEFVGGNETRPSGPVDGRGN